MDRKESGHMLTRTEIAQVLGLNERTIARMVAAQVIPCYRVGITGRGMRFDENEVKDALSQKVKEPGGEGPNE